MADITDERLREIASRGFRACGTPTEKAQLAAELLAARARIAKLEQEPPMAMVDFGVGVNWKGLHEDMQRLRAERDAARADLREALRLLREVWSEGAGDASWNRETFALLKHKQATDV